MGRSDITILIFMLKIHRIVNELMNSNCFVVYDEGVRHCIIIDPGSKESLREISFIKENNLRLDYILLTHEHTDHTWGVNTLLDVMGGKVTASKECAIELPKAGDMYFKFYFDDPTYHYEVRQIDKIVDDSEIIDWYGHQIRFLKTPGHSIGSICISIDDSLFTGDTLMKDVKPVIIKRHGGSKFDYEKSLLRIFSVFPESTKVYPGHGDAFELGFSLYNNCLNKGKRK